MKKLKFKLDLTDFEVLCGLVKKYVYSGSESDTLFSSWCWDTMLRLFMRMSSMLVTSSNKKNINLSLTIPECVALTQAFCQPADGLEFVVMQRIIEMLDKKGYYYIYEVNLLRNNIR